MAMVTMSIMAMTVMMDDGDDNNGDGVVITALTCIVLVLESFDGWRYTSGDRCTQHR